MRILHCVPTLTIGGAERQLAYLVAEQVRLGHEVHVAATSEGMLADRIRSDGATIHLLRGRGNRDPRLLWKLYSLIGKVQADVVHTRLVQMDVIGGAAAIARGAPWVLSERASAGLYRGRDGAMRALLARGAKAVEANSSAGAAYWAAVRPKLRRLVISGAVPVVEIAAAAPQDPVALQLPAGVPLVLFAGRFDEQKNVLQLLRSLAPFVRQHEAAAVLFGRGPLHDKARELARSLDIQERLRLPGFAADLWSWMKVAAVLISLSHFEGRPNTVLEAAACRCPLVVSDIPEHREFLDQHSALFVPADDAAATVAALQRVVDFPAEAAARAEHAFETVAAFTAGAMAAQIDSLYNDVVRR